MKELYDEDTAIYIGTWEVKCPICEKYTPLIGNWWLAKTKEKHAYMKPKHNKDTLQIEIIEGKTNPPQPNIKPKTGQAECLLCGSKINYINTKTMKITIKKEGKDTEYYPKHAIKDWNTKLEQYLNGQININNLKNTLARPRILVKVKIANNDLVFEPATQEDNEKLWKALEKLRQIWEDSDIPTEPLPSYDQEFARTHLWGMDKWFKLFNPRQLLTLVKLVKLIREAGKKIEEEKLKEGWSKEEAFRYAEAVTTYLAIALARLVNFNSVVTSWYSGSLLTNKAQSSLSFRGLAMTWNWCDTNILYEEGNQYSIRGNINSINRALSYLISAVSGSPSRVRVLLDDATVLSKLGGERFDVIVTDPPYRDDVSYTELSDFYYVWLKRALSGDDLTSLR